MYFYAQTAVVELIYWDAALSDDAPGCVSQSVLHGNSRKGSLKDKWCRLERAFVTSFDPVLNKTVRVPKLTLATDGRTRSAGDGIDSCQEDLLLSPVQRPILATCSTDEFFPGRQTNKLINSSRRLTHHRHAAMHPSSFAYGHLW